MNYKTWKQLWKISQRFMTLLTIGLPIHKIYVDFKHENNNTSSYGMTLGDGSRIMV